MRRIASVTWLGIAAVGGLAACAPLADLEAPGFGSLAAATTLEARSDGVILVSGPSTEPGADRRFWCAAAGAAQAEGKRYLELLHAETPDGAAEASVGRYRFFASEQPAAAFPASEIKTHADAARPVASVLGFC